MRSIRHRRSFKVSRDVSLVLRSGSRVLIGTPRYTICVDSLDELVGVAELATLPLFRAQSLCAYERCMTLRWVLLADRRRDRWSAFMTMHRSCLHGNVRVSVFSMHALYLRDRRTVCSMVWIERRHLLPVANDSEYNLSLYSAMQGLAPMHT